MSRGFDIGEGYRKILWNQHLNLEILHISKKYFLNNIYKQRKGSKIE